MLSDDDWKDFKKTCPWSTECHGYGVDYRQCTPFRWGGGAPRDCCIENCGLWAIRIWVAKALFNTEHLKHEDFKIE